MAYTLKVREGNEGFELRPTPTNVSVKILAQLDPAAAYLAWVNETFVNPRNPFDIEWLAEYSKQLYDWLDAHPNHEWFAN